MSDFNGDGFADLAVGVPNESVGEVEDAGAVNVLYGSAGGLQTTHPDDQFWTQDSPGVSGKAERNDSFGWSAAAGDFNHDGFGDLAVGAPFESLSHVQHAGAINVLYGSVAGLQATSPNDQVWHQDSPRVSGSAEVPDGFGWSLASGDFNNDGYADLAVGVPHEAVGGRQFAGAINVLYGSARGLQATSPNDQVWHQDVASVKSSAEKDDFFGWSLAAGDSNNNGVYDDLAIGVPQENVGSIVYAGAVSVIHGTRAGLRATIPDDQLWTQDSPGLSDSAEELDQMGGSLASSDFNNDGFNDLGMSVYGEDLGSIKDAGAVSVLYGSSRSLQAEGQQFWTQDSPDVEDTADVDDFFGSAQTTGDFNGDSFSDLAVGVSSETLTAGDDGAVNVLYGWTDGLLATDPSDQFWHQDSPEVDDVAERFDFIGGALASADFNGDAFSDLAFAGNRESLAFSQEGAANVLYGAAAGLQATSPPDQFWHQDSPGVDDASEESDRFGFSLAASGGD